MVVPRRGVASVTRTAADVRSLESDTGGAMVLDADPVQVIATGHLARRARQSFDRRRRTRALPPNVGAR